MFSAPLRPATDEVMTMLPPPRLAMAGMQYLRPSHTPRTLTAITRSKVAMS